MRPFSLLAAMLALAAPALAEAAVDFKCDSVNYDDQIGGWLRFDGNGGKVTLEYWNGYPPLTLVDAAFATTSALANGDTEIVSEADRSDGTVATIDVSRGYGTKDKFTAKAVMRYVSPETKKPRVIKTTLSCVRH